MRKCPQCHKTYDDSWKICMQCNAPLEAAGNGQSQEDIAVRAEIDEVRGQITQLQERLNRIEFGLSMKKRAMDDKPYEVPQKESFQQKVIQKEAPVEKVRSEKPIFKTPFIEAKKEPKKSMAENFEQVLGGQWFNKLGIFAVVIGVALLIGYSFQYLGPIGKIGLGFAFALGMSIFGRYIEKKEGFSLYGKSLIGGGWAIAYFTTFAMYNIPIVRLIHNPIVGMLCLMAVSVATVVDIYRYKSEAATGFAYLLIFITLMISPVTFFTMAAAVPVAASLIYFMRRMKWLTFGLYGMGMTYLSFAGWFLGAGLGQATKMNFQQFTIAGSFLLLYWGIFVLASLLIKDEKRDATTGEKVFSKNIGYKEFMYVANTFVASLCAPMLLNAGFLGFVNFALILGATLYLVLTVITYFIKERFLYLASSTISVIFTAWYLAKQYSGYSLTVSYILLAQVIMMAGILLKERYWRWFSFVSLLVILGKLLTIDSFIHTNTALPNHLSTRTLLFGFALAVYFVNYRLYGRLQKRSLLTGSEANNVHVFSYLYPLIYAMGTWLDLPKVLTAPCWVVLGVVLLQIGVMKGNVHHRIQGYALLIGSFVRILMSNMLLQGGISIFSYRILTCVPVLLILYYCVLFLQEDKTQKLLKDAERKMAVMFASMVFVLIMVLVWYEAPKDYVASIWGLVAIGYCLRSALSNKNYYFPISSIAALSAATRTEFVNLLQGKYLVGAEGNIMHTIFTIGILYLGNIYYLKSKRVHAELESPDQGILKTFFRSSRLIYACSATIVLTTLLVINTSGVGLTVALGLEGLLLFLFGFGLKEKYWRIFGLVILLVTLAKVFLVDLRQLSTLYYILSLIMLGIVLLFVSYIYTKHKDTIKKLM